MYRQYEDPRKLEAWLKEAKAREKELIATGASDEELISIAEDIAELSERVNFAWQDEEYDLEDIDLF